MKRPAYPTAAVLVIALVLSARLLAAEPQASDTPLVDEEVRQLMQQRDYAKALAAIEQASKAEDAPDDYLAYLKGRALFHQKQYDKAAEAFAAMEKEFPKSVWARRARFARGLAFARKGDFRTAEMIFRSEAEYLLSPDRKQQIADIYLEFADEYFTPPKEEQKPDFQKALEFYRKALEVGPKPEKRIEVELLVAQCQQELGKLDEATALYERFIKDYPESPLDVEARFRLGQCRLAQGKLNEARRTWQDLLAKYPDSPSERIPEASFQLSRTWKIPQPQDDRQLSLGVAALEAFVERFPAHKLAGGAYLDIARSYMHRGRYEDAAASLSRFLKNPRYQDREEVPEARNLLGRSYQLQKKFSEALAAWREYLGKHPTHKEWSSVQREIINTEHLMATEKLDAKEYEAARKLFSEFLAKYPLDSRNPQILLSFGRMNYEQGKWEAAIADWRRVVSKYPQTNEASLAQFSVATVFEQNLGKLEEALEEYRKVTWGSHADQAKQAIARLTAKTMRAATERVFRSDETPVLKLTTRNLESVTVRAYKVDLETYFRKMHLARGVENLDIALIDPDKTFEFEIPNYAKHQELESTVEVPLPGDAKSGVMAVTLSSEKLEATTLVVQSDLDVIVKSSRDEVFVFAENMLTGKPWSGAKLLISNGREVFAEAATGDDGVFQQEYKELKEAGDVRVFAVAQGHAASNVIGLKGVGVARGLSDKGYIYTDRPAYRAGQLVHVRGCIRHVPGSEGRGDKDEGRGDRDEGEETRDEGREDTGSSLPADAYAVEEGKQYTVEVFDSRNRLVRQEEVKLNSFGTFKMHFVLPVTSPQGPYRVLARDAAGRSHQGEFLVLEYKLEPVHLVVDTPRKVYYRGEEIEGTIRASFYYGAPLAGREIRYQLAGDRLHAATTDEKGEVQFKLPTREFQETQVIPLVVTLPERNLQTGVNFVLAAQGFAVGVSTVRPVYVAGETFEVTLTANDAEGKPVGRKLQLKVLEKTTVEGKVGERLVETHELETAEADGIARQTLKLEKGGQYVVRAEGTDRFKNPIWGELAVKISGEEDEVRLRILADRHFYKVGDKADVRLHWREDRALALVTFQGARVLDYRLVELQKGENPLEIPMTARLAPNFELAVAVMIDVRAQGGDAGGDKPIRRFHAASSPFLVERDLRVSVAAKRKGEGEGPVRPGDEVEVTVTTTDPQGNPVAAEVSLAMVEKSLMDRFAWPLVPIQDFFRGQMREPAVRTTSSITFAYRPKTRPINRRLLAERERLEIAAEEAASIEEAETVLAVRVHPAADLVTPVAPAVPLGFERDGRPADGAWTDALHLRLEQERRQRVQALGTAAVEYSHAVAGEPAIAYPDAAAWRELARRRGAIAAQSAPGGTGGLPFSGLFGGEYAGGARGGFGGMAGYAYFGNQSNARGAAGLQKADATGGVYRGAGQLFGRAPAAGQAGVVADFDSLTNLISGTVRPDAWFMQDGKQVVMLDSKGVAQNVQVEALDGLDVLVLRGDPRDVEQVTRVVAQIEELKEAGAVFMPGLGPQETGYWNPAVVTGDDGKATVTFTVPERSTAWTLMAKGLTVDTLAGEAADELIVKKDLFGELKLPLAFTDGDEAEVTVSVHNDAVEKGQIEVTLKTTVGDRTVEQKKTVEVESKGIHGLAFNTSLQLPEPSDQDERKAAPAELIAAFELTVAAGERSDVVRRSIPVKPYGMPVFATTSGSATSDTTAWVEPPERMSVRSPSLQILVGPTVERSLLDIVLGPAPSCQIEAARIASGLETTTSDLMASLGLQKLLGATREAAGPQAQALDGRIRSSLSLLVSSQNDDGGWSWTGRGGGSNRYSTARVVWATSLARKAGYTVPDEAYQKAITFLQDQVAKLDHSDYESQAILLHALSAAGRGDFAMANRLYRSRPALSSAALAHLALAFVAMDRKATAEELLGLLVEHGFEEPAAGGVRPKRCLPWSHALAELRALYALAIQEVSPQSPRAKEQVDWLLAHRTGHRWSPDKATGPAALALCRWFAESRFEGEHYKLAVFVNDVQVKVLDIDQTAGTQTIDVPASLLEEGKQRINFQITGRGRYTYQCILGGFVAADKLAGTTDRWTVKRIYEPAPLEMDGKEIPRGFDVVTGSYTTFRNPLTELPVGRRGLVELNVYRRNVPSNTPEEQLEYLVITEPIPSGASVIEDSVRGGFERFEIAPGVITFYVGSRRHVEPIHYQLHGYLPGKYRAAPTQIRNAYRPEELAVSEPKPLGVLELGADSTDPYRLTPQELYELGKRHFAKGELKTAQGHFAELVDKWNLGPEVYKEAVMALLDIHLQVGPANQVVHHFEIVKEKWPEEEIPFSKIVKVGAAYHDMGEYERSYLIFRATIESSFRRESSVAGFLESQGEFLRSVDVMGRLLREYPPESYLAAATYALAQRVYAKAPEAAGDPKLREQKVNRVDLVRRAWTMLESFLTAYPEDPAADQAAFSAANALLELEAYGQATAACNRYAERYPESDLLDSYWYIIGYCHFATGQHAEALRMCRKVAEAKRVDKQTGREVESSNKWRAVYILGQVHHSLGEPAEAIREYRRVADRFADAKEAIEYFVHRQIALDEVTTVKPGQPVQVELRFRNVASCDARVYRIDLMKFSLLRRNLGGITQINLAGIQPYHETQVQLGDGKDYRDRTHKLALPIKEEGAYLVVCRGDNLYASGLVLVTPLAVEVQEEVASGRVRTTVKDVAADRYLDDVHVKVIGSRNEDFISGETDLRGVFVADGIQGTSTVIAQAPPSRYAFFRGQTELAPPAPEAAEATESEKAPERPAKGEPAATVPERRLIHEELLQGLQGTNYDILSRQVDQLQKMYEAPAAGVEAREAF